ncbi:MAG: hAT transposon family protein, partial [Gammaproteobacteria bacterium]|nr:hAT transposon family protein [Gammaproteobacteria bacterium]
PSQLNPVLYWTGQGKKDFPLLANVSSSFLACPVSTGSAQRVFVVYRSGERK